MNEPDIKKVSIRTYVWREDMLKFSKHEKCSISKFIRDLFHGAMSAHKLTRADLRRLAADEKASLARRMELRSIRFPKKIQRKGSVLVSDVAPIPKAVRSKVKFVPARKSN